MYFNKAHQKLVTKFLPCEKIIQHYKFLKCIIFQKVPTKIQDFLKQALWQKQKTKKKASGVFKRHPHCYLLWAQMPFFLFCGVAVSFFIIICGISLEATFHSFPQARGVWAELTNFRNTLRRSTALLHYLAKVGSVCGSHSPRNHSKLQWLRVTFQQRIFTRL